MTMTRARMSRATMEIRELEGAVGARKEGEDSVVKVKVAVASLGTLTCAITAISNFKLRASLASTSAN